VNLTPFSSSSPQNWLLLGLAYAYTLQERREISGAYPAAEPVEMVLSDPSPKAKDLELPPTDRGGAHHGMLNLIEREALSTNDDPVRGDQNVVW
jgi:hypothetical protein